MHFARVCGKWKLVTRKHCVVSVGSTLRVVLQPWVQILNIPIPKTHVNYVSIDLSQCDFQMQNDLPIFLKR